MSDRFKSILVTGAEGQLGSEIKDLERYYSNYKILFVGKSKLDITCRRKLDKFFKSQKIDIIINCAAYTNVVKAESEVDVVEAVNVLAVENLAKLAKKYSIKLIHISTNDVFDGQNTNPYNEVDDTNPVNVYGQSKLDGEKLMVSVNPKNSVIIRTSWVYSKHGNNFVKSMIRLASEKKAIRVVNDQFGTPTSAVDLASLIMKILPDIFSPGVEIYHYSNEGSTSWFEFSKEIFLQLGFKYSVQPVSTSDYGEAVERPTTTVLNKRKIKESFEINIPYWKVSLRTFIKELEQTKR